MGQPTAGRVASSAPICRLARVRVRSYSPADGLVEQPPAAQAHLSGDAAEQDYETLRISMHIVFRDVGIETLPTA